MEGAELAGGVQWGHVRNAEIFLRLRFVRFPREIQGFCISGSDQTSVRRGSERDQDAVRPRSGIRLVGFSHRRVGSSFGGFAARDQVYVADIC